jgi:glycosyltransferase involved in cell wall biosynthesis
VPTIVLDMERLRNPYSGLGQYCLQLGNAFAANPASESLGFTALVPQGQEGVFGTKMQYKVVKPWHKWFGIQVPATVWHCMHQDSEFLPRNGNAQVLYTIHDLNFLERADYSKNKKQQKLAAIQQKINKAAGLVYISEYVRTQVHALLKVQAGVLERVIYNGGGHQEDVIKNEEVARKHDKPFVFSIGIHPKKNYHVLMPLLAAQKQYDWLIAGPDSRGYKEVIQDAAMQWGVEQRVHFVGPVDAAEKWRLYRQCEALLFPSISEGFGLPVVEAMAVGKPVFLSTKCSLPEVGGTEAYYFDDFEPKTLNKVFEQGMMDYQKDPEKTTRLIRWAAQFSWKAAADQYLDFYKTLS